MERPLGVTVIAILVVIGGIMSLFGGISLVIVGALLSTSFTDVSTSSPIIGSLFGYYQSLGGCIVGSWCRLHHYVLWTLERERMGMDNYNHINFNWNSN